MVVARFFSFKIFWTLGTLQAFFQVHFNNMISYFCPISTFEVANFANKITIVIFFGRMNFLLVLMAFVFSEKIHFAFEFTFDL